MNGTLTARVVDMETNAPLEGVMISGLYNSAFTDVDGIFSIDFEDKDGAEFRISYPDYIEKWGEIPDGDQDINLVGVEDLKIWRDPDQDIADVEIVADRPKKKGKFPWWLLALGIGVAASNRKSS